MKYKLINGLPLSNIKPSFVRIPLVSGCHFLRCLWFFLIYLNF